MVGVRVCRREKEVGNFWVETKRIGGELDSI